MSDEYRQEHQTDSKREARRQQARKDFGTALALAREVGWEFLEHTDAHYQLRTPNWWLEIYPGNLRLYRNRDKGKSPFLNLPQIWRLTEVVQAAIVASPGQDLITAGDP